MRGIRGMSSGSKPCIGSVHVRDIDAIDARIEYIDESIHATPNNISCPRCTKVYAMQWIRARCESFTSPPKVHTVWGNRVYCVAAFPDNPHSGLPNSTE